MTKKMRITATIREYDESSGRTRARKKSPDAGRVIIIIVILLLGLFLCSAHGKQAFSRAPQRHDPGNHFDTSFYSVSSFGTTHQSTSGRDFRHAG